MQIDMTIWSNLLNFETNTLKNGLHNIYTDIMIDIYVNAKRTS